MADNISSKGSKTFLFSFNFFNSSSVGGISFILLILQSIVAIEQNAPKKKEAYTQVGKDPV